jgi:hypothetical protein
MRRTIRSFSRKNERGTTILEILVALLILSSLGIGAWHAAGVTLKMAGRIRSSLTAGARLLQLDDQVRSAARRIRPPFWAPGKLVEVTDTTVTVPYLDGKREKSISITFRDGILTVDDGTHTVPYTGFAKAVFEAETDGQNENGIALRLEEGGKPIVIDARFGGTPVAGMSPP